MADHPFDIWFAISQYLPVQDIVRLQSTCKALHAQMSERPVWHAALHDVLATKPLPFVAKDIPAMSSSDLRATCVRLASFEKAVARTDCTPRLRSDFDAGDALRVILLPCGNRYVTVDPKGTLSLHATDSGEVIDTIPGPEETLAYSQCRVLAVTPQQCLLLHALHRSNDLTGAGGIIEMRIYRVAEHFEPLGNVTPECTRDIVYYGLNDTAMGPALVYLQGCTCRQFVAHVIPIERLHHQTMRTVSYRLRGWVMHSYMQGFMLLFGSIAFIGADRLVLATSCGLYVFKVSPLADVLDEGDGVRSETIDASPIWSTCGAWAMNVPTISTPTRYGASTTPMARCTVCTGHDLHVLDIPLYDAKDAKVSHSVVRINKGFTHQTVQSSGHGAGIHRHRNTDARSVLFSSAIGNAGHRRGQHPGQDASTVQQTTLTWEPGTCIADISLDESSGKIAVLECGSSAADASTKRIRIYQVSN